MLLLVHTSGTVCIYKVYSHSLALVHACVKLEDVKHALSALYVAMTHLLQTLFLRTT